MYDELIVRPIFNLLISIYSVIPGGDFGIALILFTILVRLLMYPLVRKQLHQTKAMRRLQPELAKIKARAKGNKQLELMQQMELFKKHGVNQFQTIGILLVQIPIFFGLYHVIQIITQHRDQVAKFAYDFLENIPAIKQLIENPDHFNNTLLGVVNLTHTAFYQGGVDIVLVLLAIVAGITQYIMSKQTLPHEESKKSFSEVMREAADGKQTDSAELNQIMMTKMIKIMPIFMVFIMLSLPGALALYYVVSNIVAVVQQGAILREDEGDLQKISNEATKQSGKKATAKARERTAREAHITRIKANESKKGK